jgi:hypothetical protein
MTEGNYSNVGHRGPVYKGLGAMNPCDNLTIKTSNCVERSIFKSCLSATTFLILPFKLQYNTLYNILNTMNSKKMDLVILFLYYIENGAVSCKGWQAENVVLIGFSDGKATRAVFFVTPAVRAHARN